MESSHPGNRSSTAHLNKDFYTFKLEPEKSPKSPLSLRRIITLQLFVVGIFIAGLITGLCIGLFANRDNEHECRESLSQNGRHDSKSVEPADLLSRAAIVTAETIDLSSFSTPSITSQKTTLQEGSEEKTTIKGLTSTFASIDGTLEEESTQCESCRKRNPFYIPQKKELFAPITGDEMKLAFDVLLERKIINTEKGATLHSNQNAVHSMCLHPPNKTEAIGYIDKGWEFPGRFVTVSVNKGSENPPYYTEYKVGPLDGPKDEITITPLLDPGVIPYNKRPYDVNELRTVLFSVFEDLHSNLKPLLMDSFEVENVYTDLHVITFGPNETPESPRVTRWSLSFRGIGLRDIDYVSALPLSGYINHESLNTSDWYVYDLYYLNQGPFVNSTELLNAYSNDVILKIKFPEGSKEYIKETVFPKRDEFRPVRENSEKPGPKTFDPSGPRFSVMGHDITWLGWSFSVSCNHLRGPSIYDVRFKNDRILYENSLSEISLVYSADDPGKDNIAYTDSDYGIGKMDIIPGVDCPEHSAMLNISFWDAGDFDVVTNPGICIFEVDAQEALWRHYGNNFRIGQNNRYLVVRYPTKIGKYDYTFDFEFHLDGKMKTKVMASGFILASFLDPYNMNSYDHQGGKTPFGYKVSSFATGVIHDHTFGFKVDLDIVDSENSFEMIHWKYGDVIDAVNSMNENTTVTKTPHYFFKNKTRYLKWESVQIERGLKIDLENQKFWTVVNNNKRNTWNVSRGYRIIPMATGTQNLGDDYPFINDIGFTKYQCSVTKRKEDEQYVRPLYKYHTIKSDKTKRYLQDMIDGENIQNEDIVTWLSVGFLHVPTSEDVPMTSRVQTGFTLKPFNFFGGTEIYDVPQYTEINNTLLDLEPSTRSCSLNL